MDSESPHCHEDEQYPSFPKDDQDTVGHPLTTDRMDTEPLYSFGESLPVVDNFMKVSVFETAPRLVRTISDQASYRKAHQTLAGAVLSAFKTRVRTGEPNAVMELWKSKDKTFLAIDFEWSETNSNSCLEWGYAAVRCNHLNAYVGSSCLLLSPYI